VKYLILGLFVILTVGGGSLIGIANTPGEWFDALNKPSFNPPGWLFSPVWTILYVLIAVAGWRVWVSRPGRGAMAVWWLQLGLNFLWSPVFFTLQSPGLALVVIFPLLLAIFTFISLTWSSDRTASVLFIPYAMWVSFASILNLSIFLLN
jgi:benzodiazapine receptor